MIRVLPQSLFGRLALVLAGGLIVAQLLSAAINFAERDRVFLWASGMQPAQRIADIVKLLDSVAAQERRRIVAILDVPPRHVSLDRAPLPEHTAGPDGPHAAMFAAVLRAALGEDRPVRIARSGPPPGGSPDLARYPAMMDGPMSMMNGQMAMPGMHRMPSGGMFVTTQVRLLDGTWVTFDSHISRQSADLPQRLLVSLAVLLAGVLLLSFVAVRWITRPLAALATAADDLGRDIRRPALPETGPVEVRRAAHAFNSMQARLVRFIDDRTRILGAMSHDLKTPLTRMRLRAELLEDDELRSRFEKDLKEMEAMVAQTLEFMRGLGGSEAAQPVDVMALLESVQADQQEMGREVAVEGHTAKPYPANASLLRRCIANLLDNAALYGKRARVVVEDGSHSLIVRILDDGPGIAQDELERVFEPFYRLESSRSRETGGTGLGLTIARNIAQTHGGDIRLRNRPEGGLEAVLELPRNEAS